MLRTEQRKPMEKIFSLFKSSESEGFSILLKTWGNENQPLKKLES
jgi:hypothetical protein